MQVKRLWTDKEIGGRIYLQACNLRFQTMLNDAQREGFMRAIMAVMHKLTATQYHLSVYRQREKQDYGRAIRAFKRDPNITKEAFELIFEFEAFLFQVKSSLDMLAKILNPLLGGRHIATTTYGGKGDKLIKGLRGYREKGDVNVPAIDSLVDLIESDKSAWIERVVDIRDQLSHHRGLDNYTFTAVQLPNGQVGAKMPSFQGLDTVQFMSQVYSNNLEYQQDFMCLSLAITLPSSTKLAPQDSDAAVREFKDEAAKYIKYRWILDTAEAP